MEPYRIWTRLKAPNYGAQVGFRCLLFRKIQHPQAHPFGFFCALCLFLAQMHVQGRTPIIDALVHCFKYVFVNYIFECNKTLICHIQIGFNPFTGQQILDSSKLKEFADDKFQILRKWKKVVQTRKKHCGKREELLVTSNFSFSHSLFKGLVSQGRQKVSLCGNGLTGFTSVLHKLRYMIFKILY